MRSFLMFISCVGMIIAGGYFAIDFFMWAVDNLTPRGAFACLAGFSMLLYVLAQVWPRQQRGAAGE